MTGIIIAIVFSIIIGISALVVGIVTYILITGQINEILDALSSLETSSDAETAMPLSSYPANNFYQAQMFSDSEQDIYSGVWTQLSLNQSSGITSNDFTISNPNIDMIGTDSIVIKRSANYILFSSTSFDTNADGNRNLVIGIDGNFSLAAQGTNKSIINNGISTKQTLYISTIKYLEENSVITLHAFQNSGKVLKCGSNTTWRDRTRLSVIYFSD